MRRALLLDTHALLFRAFFALPTMSTKAGEPTSALYGLAVMLLKLLRDHRPCDLAFALDAPQPTFRHLQSGSYKAHRPPLPDGLRRQLDALPRLLDAVGAPTFVAPGFEADDVLATLARELAASQVAVRVVTADHDLFQVARDGVDVLFVGTRGRKSILYDRAALVARYGLEPRQLPSLTALVGDASDNLPKIPGVGARTAQKLVQRFGDMRGLIAGLDHVTPAALRDTLAAASAQLLETESLARLREDVPLSPGARAAPVGAEAWPRMRALFAAWEFHSLLARVDQLARPEAPAAADDQLQLDYGR
ncbi:MAG TPA: 5'-3' exonuclease H3TH domain-containing protein [Polyangia bacterium]|nr:5'-3' exonuclease H3TH domain-containing protein [Polyangia bacterium]